MREQNIASRKYAAEIHGKVLERFPKMKSKLMHTATVFEIKRGHKYRFVGPFDFVMEIEACDGWMARAKGWIAFLEQQG